MDLSIQTIDIIKDPPLEYALVYIQEAGQPHPRPYKITLEPSLNPRLKFGFLCCEEALEAAFQRRHDLLAEIYEQARLALRGAPLRFPIHLQGARQAQDARRAS
jgi:hypothetical protein